jgi:hypothetical protein
MDHETKRLLSKIQRRLVSDENFYRRTLDLLREFETSDIDAAQTLESKVRAQAARLGFKIMHRRNGQYWCMYEAPENLPDLATIFEYIEAEKRNNG